jgi:hypothetical protein
VTTGTTRSFTPEKDLRSTSREQGDEPLVRCSQTSGMDSVSLDRSGGETGTSLWPPGGGAPSVRVI